MFIIHFFQQSWQESSRTTKRMIVIISLILFSYVTFIRPLIKLEQNRQTEIYKEEKKHPEDKQKTAEMLLDVPFIHQLEEPSLINGCEVTALAMLLNYYAIDVDKNTLAKQIEHVPLNYDSDLKGDPNQGFVGSMTDEVLAMGVFVPPIERLAKKYITENQQIVASTKTDLSDLLQQVAHGNPVWVLGSLDFVIPQEEDFISWETPTGNYQVTPLIHSGVIVGFDQKNIYINDPLYAKNRAIERQQFEATFNAMGKQSLYIIEK